MAYETEDIERMERENNIDYNDSNATTVKLALTFQKANGNSMSLNFNNIDRTKATSTNVKTLMQTIITNGAIYENVPVTAVSAKIVETETTDIDLS